ncbi:MAG: Rha family transcriptional regulator [Rhizobiales bacterium]|nr:Rha family transcriptional regulator [Hyphomicrobiales bacterium]
MNTISLKQQDLIQPNATVSSLVIADRFGKEHRHVLRAVENLEIPDLFRTANFGQAVVNRPSPLNGAPIKSKVIEMTRDGFSLLVMGFTGKKAMVWKIKFLVAFNAMEKELTKPQTQKQSYIEYRKQFISEQQAAEIQSFVNYAVNIKIAPDLQQQTKNIYYNHLKRFFNVTKYKNIPADMYEKAIAIILTFKPPKEEKAIMANFYSNQKSFTNKQMVERHLAEALFHLRETDDTPEDLSDVVLALAVR